MSARSAVLRLRVTATLTFSLHHLGTGVVLEAGASTKGGKHTEVSVKVDIPAPDKIGMSISGKSSANKANMAGLHSVDEASVSVVVSEKHLVYLTVLVTREKVNGSESFESLDHSESVGYGISVAHNGKIT